MLLLMVRCESHLRFQVSLMDIIQQFLLKIGLNILFNIRICQMWVSMD